MNTNCPPFRCHVRLPFISDRQGTEPAHAFGLYSAKARALGFHVMLQSGAHYRNVPIHALTTDPESPARQLQDVQLWDCFSSNAKVIVWDYLVQHEAWCYLRSERVAGTYMFTVDWLPDDAVTPGLIWMPDQNKCGHVLELDDGNICCLPTNKIAWRDGYFCGKDPHPELRGYKVQSDTYHAETCEFDASREDAMYYGQ